MMIDDVNGCFFYMLGNYPYPTDYITNGGGELPAYPVRVACGFMNIIVCVC
jgi:hypothetical protein